MVSSHPIMVSRSVTVSEQTDPQHKCMLETVHLAKSLFVSPCLLRVSPGLLEDKLSIIKQFLYFLPTLSPFLDS